MGIWKKGCGMLLALALLLTLLSFTALAEEGVRYGNAGPLRYQIENGEAAIIQCDQNVSGRIEVPAAVEGCPVTCIGNCAFRMRTEITEIVLPDTVKRIELSAFEHCYQLRSVRLPAGLTQLGNWAFSHCTSLQEITLPNSLKTLDGGTFVGDTALTSVTLPNGLTDLGPSTFDGCTKLRSITLPQSLTKLEYNVFHSCIALEEIDIPQNVRSIGGTAFQSCNALRRVQMPARLDSIGPAAFEFCGSLQQITVPEGVKAIERETFRYCGYLTAVSLPSTLERIDDRAFDSCVRLRAITLPDRVSQLGEYVFADSGVERLAIPAGVRRLPARSLACCPDLVEVTIPAGVLQIEDGCFSGSEAIRRVTVAPANPVYMDVDGVLYTRIGRLVFDPPGKEPRGTAFIDVPADAYYADSVAWAVAQEITNGTSINTFSPTMECSRAQAVTFLWRAAGCPAPTITNSPFDDVQDPDSYFYDAVLWAVESGITNGMTPNVFGINNQVTRAQTVTFLWRAAGRPAAGTGALPFADVPVGSYYYDAVRWAVRSGITNGTSATAFSPNGICTRAQIVTFLYRAQKQ